MGAGLRARVTRPAPILVTSPHPPASYTRPNPEAPAKTPIARREAGETALLDQARAGSPDALATLYRKYGAPVYRIAYRLTARSEDAEDVLHDVFLGLPEALRSYAARGSFTGWLYRVATRTALMRLRSARRRRETTLVASRVAVSPATVVERLSIETAMESLPDSLRVVFVLREIEGYSHAEIGEMLGIREGASKVRLHRARRALRTMLEAGR